MTRSLLLVLCVSVGIAACSAPRDAARDTAPDAAADGQWITLYDGGDLSAWHQAGPGAFETQPDGSIVGRGGMGLFYYADRPFRDFVLEFDWKAATDSANSGVFVRFPEATDDPWHAVTEGYEIQIDNTPGRNPINMTGAIYDISAAFRDAAKPAGEWNSYRIEVRGQHYQIYLNDVLVNDFIGDRGREGYIGLQNHDDLSRVWYRDIRVMPLADSGAPESLADVVAVDDEREPVRVLVVTATHGFRHTPAIDALREVLGGVESTTEFEFDFTEDTGDFTAAKLGEYDVLFLANSTLRLDPSSEAGDENSWSVRLTTPQGTMDGTMVLGPEGGTIVFPGQGGEVELTEYQVQGGAVSFQFDAGQYGTATVTGNVANDAFDGTLALGQTEMPMTGRRAAVADGPAPVTEAQRAAILDFVRGGGGLAVAHAGLDAFYEWPEYRAMVGGGLFESHPWTQSVRVINEDPSNPAVSHLGDSFWINDEIYVLDENPRWNSQVLLSLDAEEAGLEGSSAGMMERGDYPIAWIRREGEGRVFVTKLGHFADVWKTPAYLTHVLQGLRIAAGTVAADFGGRRVKEVIAENVWPDDIAVDNRGNVWIVELDGGVHHYDAATGVTRKIAAIETTDPHSIEHGLYGIEVDPNFYNGEPYIYLMYAEPETFINKLSRFTYRDGQLDLASEEEILNVPTEPACCHQAGDLEWGPDGTLYISTGDTGQSSTRPDMEITDEAIQAFVERNDLNDFHWSRLADSERTSQNLQSLRGKILRINKDGTIPKDNPFYGEPGVRWEIYAYGLRNPYRFKVDPATGDVLIGVVGPDASFDYDEYNLATEGGENFGWPRTIGRLFYNEWKPEDIENYTPPIWEYTYADGARSATGGPTYVSDGPYAFPEAFQGKVFIADWSRKWIKWGELVRDGAVMTDTTSSVKDSDWHQTFQGVPRLTNVKTFDVLLEGTSPISLELSPDGSLYVAEFDGFWEAGGGARVTRYRWIRDEATPPVGAAPGTERSGSDGDR